MSTTANWLSNELLKSGCDSANVYKTNGHPIVYGEKILDNKKKSVKHQIKSMF